jgi:hypothetical protein
MVLTKFKAEGTDDELEPLRRTKKGMEEITKQQPPDTAAARRAPHRAEGRRSRLDWRHEPQDDCTDCCGLMLTGRTGQTIRALKHVGSLYS